MRILAKLRAADGRKNIKAPMNKNNWHNIWQFLNKCLILQKKIKAEISKNRKIMGIIGSIIIGCLAGFCAGKLMKGGGFGFIMNLVLGLFGGVLGGWLFEQLGIQWGGILGQLGTAIIGSVAILWIASFFKK